MELLESFLTTKVFTSLLRGQCSLFQMTERVISELFVQSISPAVAPPDAVSALLKELGMADDPDLAFLLLNGDFKLVGAKKRPLFSSRTKAIRCVTEVGERYGISTTFEADREVFCFTLNNLRLRDAARALSKLVLRQSVELKARNLEPKFIFFSSVLERELRRAFLEDNDACRFAVHSSKPPIAYSVRDYADFVPVEVATITAGYLCGLELIPVQRELSFLVVSPDLSKA